MNETKKIIVWSDLHAHAWQEGERPDRWKDFVRAIDCVYDYASKVQAAAVIFNGDLFESKQAHSSYVWAGVVAALERGREKNPDAIHVLNTGNHDLYRGESVLSAFEHRFCVSKSSACHGFSILVGDRSVRGLVLPWEADIKPHGRVDYLFTHAEITGLRHGHGMSSVRTNIDPCWVGSARFIINGHIHVQQKHRALGSTVITVGPTIPISWTEIDDQTKNSRGLLEITLSENPALDKINRVHFSWAPRFLHKGEGTPRPGIDFVRKELNEEDQEEESASEESSERRKFIAHRGAEMCEAYVTQVYSGDDSEILLDYGKSLLLGAE